MKAMLEELKRIDPACYEDIRRRVIIDVDEDFEIYANNQVFRENVDDTIQGCVQRATEARGLMWMVSSDYGESTHLPNGEPYEAIIYNDDMNILVEDVYEDSPAKAILRAYLQEIGDDTK